MNSITSIFARAWRQAVPLFGSPEMRNFFVLGLILSAVFLLPDLLSAAATHIPGSDESGKLEAAGTLLRLVDTAVFLWGSRIFAGLCILSAGWSLKEQRFGMAVVCVLGAIVIGTAPMWVKNIFEIGGGSIFN